MSAESFPTEEANFAPVISEFFPRTYLTNFRSIMRQHDVVGKGNAANRQIAAEMYFEEVRSAELVDSQAAADIVSGLPAEEKEWLRASFSEAMARLVKSTALASKRGLGLVAHKDLPEEQQQAVRVQLLQEIVDACHAIAPTGKPSKSLYEGLPILYQSPEEMRSLVSGNPDFSRGEISRLIVSYPRDTAGVIIEIRQKIVKAMDKYPMVPQGEIRRLVTLAKDGYEHSIERYAAKKGIDLNANLEERVSPEKFLEIARTLIRNGNYKLSHLNPSPVATQEANQIAEEAGELMDEMSASELDSTPESVYKLLKGGFMQRLKLLALLSDRAWRKGDMPTPVSKAQPEFRRSLYAVVLADFVVLQSLVAEDISQFSVKNNPVLQIDPAEVDRLVSQNRDIAISYLARLIIRNPQDPQGAIGDFRERVEQLKAADPRLLEHDAKYLAMTNPNGVIADKSEHLEKIPPADLLNQVRAYLATKAHPGTKISDDVAKVIKERQPEIESYLNGLGWTFGGVTLPLKARTALLEKIKNFIVVNDRGYRRKVIPVTIAHYDEEERLELYRIIGEDFTDIASLLGASSLRDWSSIPVIYRNADEIKVLRKKYPEFSDNEFTKMVYSHSKDLPTALEGLLKLKTDLRRQYPGVTEAMLATVLVRSPQKADEKIMDHLARVSEREWARYNSRVGYIDAAKRPKPYLVNLRTLFRSGQIGEFIKQTESRMAAIDELKRRGAFLLRKKHPDASGEMISAFRWQIHRYALGSETVAINKEYDRLLHLSPVIQNTLIGAIYENHVEITNKIASITGKEEALRVTEFGFYNTASYLGSLLNQYKAYFPPSVIVYAALVHPKQPFQNLNDLVRYRAGVIKANPDISDQELNKIITAEVKSSSPSR